MSARECEAPARRSATNFTGRCPASPPGTGNMSLHDYCKYCSRNLCDYHLARHHCGDAKRAGAKKGQCAANHGEDE